jgi:hypothetical protein
MSSFKKTKINNSEDSISEKSKKDLDKLRKFAKKSLAQEYKKLGKCSKKSFIEKLKFWK